MDLRTARISRYVWSGQVNNGPKEVLVLGQLILFAYAVVVCAAFAAMVRWHEEPALHRQFGEQYDTYRAAVPGWVPRLRPWQR